MSLSHSYHVRRFSYLFLNGHFDLNPFRVWLCPQEASINEAHLRRERESIGTLTEYTKLLWKVTLKSHAQTR